jgi:predicted negative regulator of RcsB-dependent stress response
MTSAASPPPLSSLAWRVAPFGQVKLTAPQVKVQATRADMATLRGRYQLAIGNQPGAEADWQTALAVDPQHELAKELLQRLKNSR